jgi:hypothetical protein
MNRRRAAVAALGLALAVAGCGKSDEDKARDAVRGYFDAVADGDGPEACGHLASEARKGLEAGAASAGAGPGGCGRTLDRLLDAPNARRIRRSFDEVEVGGAKLKGDTGTVTIRGAAGEVPLPVRKEDGGWRVAMVPRAGP